MEIDDNLKNRLAGVAVVTVLAVIFLPMLFDDPVEKKGQVVAELDIPHKPEVSPLLATGVIPEQAAAVTNAPKTKTAVVKPMQKSANDEVVTVDNNLSNAELDAETLNPEELESEPVPAKKSHKRVVVAQNNNADVEEKSWQPKEKKQTKKGKPELPVLDIDDTDKDKKKSASANRRWTIQVASLTDEKKAVAFRDKLRSQGFPATISEALVKGKRVYRLKVGPELDADRAQSIKSKINQLNNVNSIAIPE